MVSEFSSRMQQILKILLGQEGAMSVGALAEQMNISKRTVQRELEYVERPLRKYHLRFCSKTGTGVWLEGEEEDRRALLSLLEADDTLDVTDKSQRRKRLILEILKDKEVKKLYYYGNLFGVSEATVSSDLEAVEGWLSGFGLKVVRKQGLGVSIEGTEGGFRQALSAFISENINTGLVQSIYDNEDRDEPILKLAADKDEKNIYHVLDSSIMKRVIGAVNRLGDRRIMNLTENSYRGLIIHVTIAVNRIMKQEIMEDNPDLLSQMEKDEDFHLAREIVQELEREFSVSIPDVEAAYICLHIQGAKVQQIQVDDSSRAVIDGYRELFDTVNEMIDRYDKEQAYALKQDEEFVVQGLAAHLQPTLVRLANHMKIQNPLLEHIKTEYGDIYKRCEEVAKVIEERYGYEVPDTEIGFLAIHFGAAMVRLENRRESSRKVYIGVVCASGIGISRLMMSKLKRQFMDRAEISAYGSCDLNPYVLERLDFLVSTLPLKEDIETISVSPLLSQEEMEHIEKRVRFYERMPARKREQDAFTRQLEQVNYMAVQIKSLIQDMGYLLVSPDVSFEEMLAAISEMLSPYNDRRWLIREDLKKRERLGTQVYPDFGFALFHTKTGGVVKPSFSLCRTKGNVPFADPYFQGVGLVIVMLLPEDEHRKENQELLGYLSGTLVEDFEFLETLSAGAKEEVQAVLSRYLKRFFNQYLDKI